jgi:predicted AAA+ superfamily ATPase
MYRERRLSEKLQKMVAAFPITVLSGARQVGKTTLLRHLFPKFDYFVFDPAIDLENARKEPDLFLRNHPAPLILDEIQYAPELAASLKRRVDATDAQAGQYVVTGSQQWQVMRSLAESLAGRAVFLDLEGFALAEAANLTWNPGWLSRWLESPDELVRSTVTTNNAFTGPLWEWLWRGSLPGVQEIPVDLVPEFWMSYQRTYIERDARLAGDVHDWQHFGQFIRLVSALTAQEINYSELGREIGMTPQTARRWLAVLAGTFQWFEIPSFSGNAIKRVSGKPKGHLADTGLVCHLAQLSTPRALGGHPLLGAIFETAMVHEVRKQNACLPGKGSFSHWRSAGGAEVDLILERDGRIIPFEIKMTAHPTRRDASGLLAFRKSYPDRSIAKAAVLCATERPFWITDEVAALPWNLL